MKNDNAVQHNNQTASEQTLSPDESHVLHKVRDPVCGMTIMPDKAHSSIRYQEHQLYFCSASGESKFKAHPDHYLTEDASEHSQRLQLTIYHLSTVLMQVSGKEDEGNLRS